MFLFWRNKEYYIKKGDLAFKNKKYEKAIKSYNKAIALEKSDFFSFFKRGNTFSKIKNHEKAIDDYTTVLSLNAAYSEAYFKRSIEFDKMGYISSAIEDMTEYIKKNPAAYEGYNLRCKYYCRTGEYEPVISDLNKMITISPTSDLLCKRGELKSYKKKYAEAMSDYKRAYKINTNDAKASDGIGKTLFLLNKKEEAVEWLENAVKLNSTNINTFFYLGLYSQENKNFNKALSYYEQGTKMKGETLTALFCNLGICYCYLNEFDDAQKTLHKALEINPDESTAKEVIENIKSILDIQRKEKKSKTIGEIKTNIRKGRTYPCVIHKNEGITCLYGHPILKGPKGCNSVGVPCYWDNYIESTYLTESNLKNI